MTPREAVPWRAHGRSVFPQPAERPCGPRENCSMLRAMRLTPARRRPARHRALRRAGDAGARAWAGRSSRGSAPTRASSVPRPAPSRRWRRPRPRSGSTATRSSTSSRRRSRRTTGCGRRTSPSARGSTGCSATSCGCWWRRGRRSSPRPGPIRPSTTTWRASAGGSSTVPYRDDAEDPEALLLAARKAGAPLVYLANPDNPMGSWHSGARIAEMIARLPGGCVLCLDEAYADFAPAGALPPLDVGEPRVIRMRTFSKAHGMAGARIGYALGPSRADRGLRPGAQPLRGQRASAHGRRAGRRWRTAAGWPRWSAAVAAGAGAHRRRSRRRTGSAALPSATNFVAIDCGRDGAFARRVLEALVAPRHLRAQAVRGAAGPLHPGHRRARGRPRRLRRGAAGGARRRRLNRGRATSRPGSRSSRGSVSSKARSMVCSGSNSGPLRTCSRVSVDLGVRSPS